MPSQDSKKRKREHERKSSHAVSDTSKPTAVFQASGKERGYTVSIALPGSVIANAQSHDLKTSLAGQIARAAAVFCVDEIVIFNDGQSQPRSESRHQQNRYRQHHSRDGSRDFEAEDGHTGWSDPDHFLAHVLSYLECPPYLRARLFPLHPNLRTAGTLPSLDMPHHLRAGEWCEYREGITVEPPRNSNLDGTFVDVGLKDQVHIDASIPPKTRVTLKLPARRPRQNEEVLAEAVAPTTPREEDGFYWGYTVRSCSSLSAVFTEPPFQRGYDVSIGTSERGLAIESALPKILTPRNTHESTNGAVPSHLLPDHFNHLLIVFGGVTGLEAAASADADLSNQGITSENVRELFDAWVNVCPGQGSRTIRTEEAVWLGLAAFKPYIRVCGVESVVEGDESDA